MINYTERLTLLMQDVIRRVPALGFIDLDHVLVFARYGRSQAEGAFATCHCLTLPPTEPGYYYWRDRRTGRMTRRSMWFVTKSPTVSLAGRKIHYLISFTIPRFCNQTLARSRKQRYYPDAEPWIAKLDTVVHELYHIDPEQAGIRRIERSDGSYSPHSHSHDFLEEVAGMVKTYLASDPDPMAFQFLRYSFSELTARFGGVVGTTFRSFPSFPQRYMEALTAQPKVDAHVRIEPIKQPHLQTRYTDADLDVRQFFEPARAAVSRKNGRSERWSRRLHPALLEPSPAIAAGRDRMTPAGADESRPSDVTPEIGRAPQLALDTRKSSEWRARRD